MDDTSVNLELDCSVCGQNGEITTDSPVQWQAFYDLWNNAHKHTAQERRAYYKANAGADAE